MSLSHSPHCYILLYHCRASDAQPPHRRYINPTQSPISFHRGGPPIEVLELCQLLPQAFTTRRVLPTSTIQLEGLGMSAPLLVVDMEYDSTSGRGCVYLRVGQ